MINVYLFWWWRFIVQKHSHKQIDSTLVWTPVQARKEQEKRAISSENLVLQLQTSLCWILLLLLFTDDDNISTCPCYGILFIMDGKRNKAIYKKTERQIDSRLVLVERGRTKRENHVYEILPHHNAEQHRMDEARGARQPHDTLPHDTLLPFFDGKNTTTAKGSKVSAYVVNWSIHPRDMKILCSKIREEKGKGMQLARAIIIIIYLR